MLPNLTHIIYRISIEKHLFRLSKLGSTIYGETTFHKAAWFLFFYNYICEIIIGDYFSFTCTFWEYFQFFNYFFHIQLSYFIVQVDFYEYYLYHFLPFTEGISLENFVKNNRFQKILVFLVFKMFFFNIGQQLNQKIQIYYVFSFTLPIGILCNNSIHQHNIH